MALAETLDYMAATMSSRQLIAAVVEQARLHRVWDVTKLAREAGVARGTVYRVQNGEPAVSLLSLRQIERSLELPDELLLMIDRGMVNDVAAIPADDWPSQRMRLFVLTEMGYEPPRNRRTTDRKRA